MHYWDLKFYELRIEYDHQTHSVHFVDIFLYQYPS